MTNKHTVFVYGTLRKHEVNAGLLHDASTVSLQARTHGVLYITHEGYPAMVATGAEYVFGEVYTVNDEQLATLDALEGYSEGRDDGLYKRIAVQVETDEGPLQAFTYVYLPDAVKGCTPISLGDWKTYQMRQNPHVFYFAYGSAMDNHRLIVHGVNALFQDIVGRGVLEDYSLQFTIHSDDGGRADIVEGSGVVEGKVYRIEQPAVDYLFQREGVHRHRYRPSFVDLMVNGEILANVLTFVVRDKKQEIPPPYWYAEEILRGATGTVSESYRKYLIDLFYNRFHLSFSREDVQTPAHNLDNQTP